LRAHGVGLLVDIRRFPASRRHPQFGREALEASLAASGVGYAHEADLGGHRKPRPDSPNTAWRVEAFRGYADHMATPAFRDAVERLIERARERTTSVMCAEAVPWRCHRQLLADALAARGIEVRHVFDLGRTEPHALHQSARVLEDGSVVYPAEAPSQGSLRMD